MVTVCLYFIIFFSDDILPFIGSQLTINHTDMVICVIIRYKNTIFNTKMVNSIAKNDISKNDGSQNERMKLRSSPRIVEVQSTKYIFIL